MKLHTELAGPRLRIRDYRPADLDFAAGMWLDPENGRYLSDPTRDYVDTAFQSALDTLQDSPLGYYLTVCLGREPVGTCCLFPDESGQEYDIGYCVHKSRWGQGFGAEIVDLLAAWVRAQGGKRMTAEVADANLPSRRLLEGRGFVMGPASEFKKYHMDLCYPSHIYRLALAAPAITLGLRTAETAAVSFARMDNEAIRKTLPMRAQSVEEAVADFHASQSPGASSFGRTILADARHVGDVWCYGIDRTSTPNAMVSYCVFEQPLWGQGAASTALALFLREVGEKYGLNAVGAFTFADNLPSIRVLEKNGFRLMEEFVEDGAASRYYQLDLHQEKG